MESFRPPAPGPGEVAIGVTHTGVNYADCVVRMGLYAPARKYGGFPICPGFDLAGHVTAVGDGVEQLRVGDAVLGVTRFDAYADAAVLPATQVFAVPASLSLAQAAAFPTVHLTAWYALREVARVRPGESVLVHSAAGGVGGAAVQIARVLGCVPIGVVGGAHKVEVARRLGAHAVIDRSLGRPWEAARARAEGGYDVVLDANGADSLRRGYALLAPGGKLVIYGFHGMLPRGRGRPSWLRLALTWLRTPRFDPLKLTGDNHGVHGFNLAYMLERTDRLRAAMTELLAWQSEGKLVSPPVRCFPASEVGAAHRALESGETVGKLVLAW